MVLLKRSFESFTKGHNEWMMRTVVQYEIMIDEKGRHIGICIFRYYRHIYKQDVLTKDIVSKIHKIVKPKYCASATTPIVER